MMGKGKIDITVSGGNVNFGNVSQGDQNTNSVQAQTITVQEEKAFADFFHDLEENRSRPPEHASQIEALKNDITSLKAALEQSRGSEKSSLADTAKAIYEKYGWAGELLKKLFVVLIPGWPSLG